VNLWYTPELHSGTWCGGPEIKEMGAEIAGNYDRARILAALLISAYKEVVR
jgi:hypothetical protein